MITVGDSDPDLTRGANNRRSAGVVWLDRSGRHERV